MSLEASEDWLAGNENCYYTRHLCQCVCISLLIFCKVEFFGDEDLGIKKKWGRKEHFAGIL